MDLVNIAGGISSGETSGNFMKTNYPRLYDVVGKLGPGFNITELENTLVNNDREFINMPEQRIVLDVILSMWYGVYKATVNMREVQSALMLTLGIQLKIASEVEVSATDPIQIRVVTRNGCVGISAEYIQGVPYARITYNDRMSATYLLYSDYTGATAAGDNLLGVMPANTCDTESKWFKCEPFYLEDGTVELWRPSYKVAMTADKYAMIYGRDDVFLAYVVNNNTKQQEFFQFRPGTTRAEAINGGKHFTAANMPKEISGWEISGIAIPNAFKHNLQIGLIVDNELYDFEDLQKNGDTMTCQGLTDFLYQRCWNTKLVYVNPMHESYSFVVTTPDFDTDIILMRCTPNATAGNVSNVYEVLQAVIEGCIVV